MNSSNGGSLSGGHYSVLSYVAAFVVIAVALSAYAQTTILILSPLASEIHSKIIIDALVASHK